MKWIFLAVFALVVFLLFRRMNREQRLTPDSAPALQPGPGMDLWAQRSPMGFDDFYNRYYAASKLDRYYVQKTLQFIAANGGVSADRVRPEDRIEDFPKKNLAKMAGFAEKVLAGPVGTMAQQHGLDVSKVQLKTVDDIMRQFEAYGPLVGEEASADGQPPEEGSQWR